MIIILCSTLVIVFNSSEVIFLEFVIVSFSNWSIRIVILLDQIRSLFLFRVSLIRLSVINFSISYIKDDKNFIRFHYLLIVFILSMYFLILSPNLVRILLGWDGLGLSSYLLVIYYGNSKAYNSGIVTVLTNRLGDSLILLRIGYTLIFGNWNMYFYNGEYADSWSILILILAACTKRAQIPFSAWLPAAIAAPTPVSSLVHSSTLVTAGVYLLIRHRNWFLINNISYYILIIGTFTIIIARISALYETDLKKIVALSTLRQLGAMFLALGLGGFLMRYFHLLTHAFFKALLFLCTGTVIHRRKNYQDLRMTGSRIFSLPTINSFTLISRFSLIGLPFISAFFSKEIILEFILLKNHNPIIYFFMILGVGLTALYRARFIMLVFSFWNLNDLLTFKSEEDFFILKRILILLFPASLRGAWLRLYLFTNLKLYESIFYFKTIIILLLILFPLLILISNSKKINWDFYLWRLRSIWLLPFITTQIFCYNRINSRWARLKIFDRGRFKYNSKIFSSIYFLVKVTVPLKLVYKILRLILIWIIFVFIIYICKL